MNPGCTMLLRLAFIATLAGLPMACSVSPQIAPNPATPRAVEKQRQLLVFLDGTSNKWSTRSNVRRLFEVVAAQEDPTRICFYIEGVGTARGDVIGKALAFGLRERAMRAYEFLAQTYRPGDQIYVFGFSRGAHSARTLCGILAHCGLYDATPQNVRPNETAKIAVPKDRIWNLCTTLPDIGSNPSEVAVVLEANRKRVAAEVGGKFQSVEVEFLGLWDTVPGLQFTKYDEEGSQTGLPAGRSPRYKVKPYPNIRTFEPLLTPSPWMKSAANSRRSASGRRSIPRARKSTKFGFRALMRTLAEATAIPTTSRD